MRLWFPENEGSDEDGNMPPVPLRLSLWDHNKTKADIVRDT
jgi:hypothetical protein